MNRSEVWKKVEATARLWTWRNLPLKRKTEVCASYIDPFLFNNDKLAGVGRGTLDRQQGFRIDAGNFTRGRALWWFGGINWTRVFHCCVMRPLCELIEGFMIRVLDGKFYVLEASSVCTNVVPSLKRISIACSCVGSALCESWHGRQDRKGFMDLISSSLLSWSLSLSTSLKLRAERVRLSSSKFSERWVRVVEGMT